jgi:hypothetical protein
VHVQGGIPASSLFGGDASLSRRYIRVPENRPGVCQVAPVEFGQGFEVEGLGCERVVDLRFASKVYELGLSG